MIFVLAFSITMLAFYFSDNSDLKDVFKDTYPSLDFSVFAVIQFMIVLISALAFIGNTNLILLHIWLKCNNLTTFEYI